MVRHLLWQMVRGVKFNSTGTEGVIIFTPHRTCRYSIKPTAAVYNYVFNGGSNAEQDHDVSKSSINTLAACTSDGQLLCMLAKVVLGHGSQPTTSINTATAELTCLYLGTTSLDTTVNAYLPTIPVNMISE